MVEQTTVQPTLDDETCVVQAQEASSSDGDGSMIHVLYPQKLIRCQSGGSSLSSMSSYEDDQLSMSLGRTPLQGELREADEMDAETKASVQQLRDDMTRKMEKLDQEMQAQKRHFEELLTQKDDKITRLEETVKWKEKELEQREKEKQWKDEEIQQKEKMIKERDDRISQLITEKDKLVQDMQNLTCDVSSLQKELENLRNQRDELKREFEKMQLQLKEMSQQKGKQSPATIERTLKENQSVMARLTQVLSNLTDQQVSQPATSQPAGNNGSVSQQSILLNTTTTRLSPRTSVDELTLMLLCAQLALITMQTQPKIHACLHVRKTFPLLLYYNDIHNSFHCYDVNERFLENQLF